MLSLLGLTAGCANRAHQDMYRAKMANEIRVLEDQLYDADYQNRVLRDELERMRGSESEHGDRGHNTRSFRGDSHNVDEYGDDEYVPLIQGESEETIPMESQLGPSINRSDIAFPPDLPTELPTPPPAEDTRAENRENAKIDSQRPSGNSPSDDTGSAVESIPAPSPDPSNHSESPTEQILPEPVPPGPQETEVPPIVPGKPLPPSREDAAPDGKVEFEQNAMMLQYETPEIEPIPEPHHLKIHHGLSGGHQFDSDSDIDGLFLIVTVADKAGKILSLDQFDVDAKLSIVVVDPKDNSSENRIGRWDFTPDQVRKMVRSSPVDGLHIPIQWQDRIPTGDDVIVHVRLAAAEEEMRCQGKLRLEEAVAMANWLPRG